MINRNVLADLDLISLQKFDFFNDYRDTRGWLRGVGTSASRKAIKKLDALNLAYKEQQFQKRKGDEEK